MVIASGNAPWSYGVMKTFLTASALILVVAVAGGAAHHLYETHMSSGYAPILRAALDPNASEADEAAYLRQARLAIRTDQDRATNEKLDQAFQYAAANCTEQFRDTFRLSEQSIESSMDSVQAVREFGSRSVEDEVAYAKSQKLSASADAASKAFDQCSASQAKDNKIAITMFQELRAAAGLPALKPAI
jgi:hypothetical protein